MPEPSHFDDAEQAEIRNHAQRVSAYFALRKLVEQSREELALQQKADYIAARAAGALLALGALIAAVYFGYQVFDLLGPAGGPAIAIARQAPWYLAAISLAFTTFSFGVFWATQSMPPRWLYLALVGLPLAAFLFFAGLIGTPFIVWLLGS